MAAVHDRAENAGVLRYLGQGLDPAQVSAGPVPPDVNTWRLGAHPDIVSRLWEELNGALPADARHLVAGGAALVHPTSGIVLGTALGTQYALHLTPGGRDAAVLAGAETVHTYRTVDVTLDLATTFGRDWVFGTFDEREAQWLSAAYELYAA